MHRDQKVGLALAILLVGVVGAFFFRNETETPDDVPKLKNPKRLDEQIAEMPYAPYLTGVETGDAKTSFGDTAAGTLPNATSAEATAGTPVRPAPDAHKEFQPSDDGWKVPDFLKDPTSTGADVSVQTVKSSTQVPAPDPIPLASENSIRPERTEIPKHNNAWESTTPPAIPSNVNVAKENRASEAFVTHRVQKGETLSEIAAKYLGSSARFREVFEANRDQLAHPDNLKVGMELKIPRQPDSSAKVSTPDVGGNSNNGNAPSAVKGRFQPVRRSPYQPGPLTDRTSMLEKESKPVKSLTQVPPPGVPQLEDDGDSAPEEKN